LDKKKWRIGGVALLVVAVVIVTGWRLDWFSGLFQAQETAVQAEQQQQDASDTKEAWEAFMQTADALYEAALMDNNRQLAFSLINRLEQQAASESVRIAGNKVGWLAFDQSMREAQRALGNGKQGQAIDETTRIALAVEALAATTPSWLRYELVLEDDLLALRDTWLAEGATSLDNTLTALTTLQDHVNRISLAAMLANAGERVNALQAQIDLTQRALKAGSQNPQQTVYVEGTLLALGQSITQLFDASGAAEEQATAMPLDPIGEQGNSQRLLLTMYISAAVIAVLAYVAYRRYRYEQDKGKPFKK
jgi:hypothetical protein